MSPRDFGPATFAGDRLNDFNARVGRAPAAMAGDAGRSVPQPPCDTTAPASCRSCAVDRASGASPASHVNLVPASHSEDTCLLCAWQPSPNHGGARGRRRERVDRIVRNRLRRHSILLHRCSRKRRAGKARASERAPNLKATPPARPTWRSLRRCLDSTLLPVPLRSASRWGRTSRCGSFCQSATR